MTISVRSMPMRSASMPTNGTMSPPVPHAKPIISDDTVAALIGAIICPKVTFTGSVDCSRNPPIASTATSDQPDEKRRDGQERHRGDQRQDDHAPRAESIRERTAEEAAAADREEIDRRRGARLRDRHAAPRQHHRHERREATSP